MVYNLAMTFRRWPTSIETSTLKERATEFSKRSIKGPSKVEALQWVLRLMDLTTLEGADTEGKVRALCQKAMYPNYRVKSLPHVAAVCVYPKMVPVAKACLEGSPVRVASVATAFPSGQVPLELKIEETEAAIALGADEIDMVISRDEFLRGKLERVFDEVAQIRTLCEDVTLKVILETGELGSLEFVREASFLAMEAGADFIKTSTGKLPVAASLPVMLVMLEAIQDFEMETGRVVGIKPAGGIRSAKESIAYVLMVKEVLGSDWLTPDRFRIGASSLLNDVLMRLEEEETGHYQSPTYFSVSC